MKRKLLSFVLTFAFVLTAGFCLTACGGGNEPNKLKISVTEFSDQGIETVGVYYTENPDSFTSGDNESLRNLRSNGMCYNIYRTNKFDAIELNEGQYAGIVVIRLAGSHEIGGSLENGYDLTVKVNEKECDLIPISSDVFASYPFESYDYLAVIGEDGKFSSDLTITLTGNTSVKTYTPTVTIKNYDSTDTRYNDLKFKFFKDNTAVEIGGKTEFDVADVNNSAFELPSATYFEQYKVVAYFETDNKFFPTKNCLNSFWGDVEGVVSENFEVFWLLAHGENSSFNYTSSSINITLDFSAFEGVTLDDMTNFKKVEFKYGENITPEDLSFNSDSANQVDYSFDVQQPDGCLCKSGNNLKFDISIYESMSTYTIKLNITRESSSSPEVVNLSYNGTDWELEGTNESITFEFGRSLTINYTDVTKINIEKVA